MKTAFLSEFITSKNVLMQSVVIYVVVSLVIGVSMQSPIAMVACIGAMTPFLMVFTFCALDGLNGWERFRATLPVFRAAIVASRYANVLVASVFVLFLRMGRCAGAFCGGVRAALRRRYGRGVRERGVRPDDAFVRRGSGHGRHAVRGIFHSAFRHALRHDESRAYRARRLDHAPAGVDIPPLSARYGAVALRYLDVARPECRFRLRPSSLRRCWRRMRRVASSPLRCIAPRSCDVRAVRMQDTHGSVALLFENPLAMSVPGRSAAGL